MRDVCIGGFFASSVVSCCCRCGVVSGGLYVETNMQDGHMWFCGRFLVGVPLPFDEAQQFADGFHARDAGCALGFPFAS